VQGALHLLVRFYRLLGALEALFQLMALLVLEAAVT
jgi:hypothetical protein